MHYPNLGKASPKSECAPQNAWVALMMDVDPEDLKNCTCDFPALFYVHPNDYRPAERVAHQRWVRIQGKHRDRDAAYGALDDMMATRQ
jgi:hypothetical protein